MSDRVCAIVVTYNRKALLTRCLGSLLRQTRAPDAILVVDNCSTDGTEVMLTEQFGQISRLRLETNSGGAGGFHEGMKWAFQRGFDWLWLMDDDVEATPEALADLLGFQAISDFIHPRRLSDTGEPFPWEGMLDPTTLGRKSYPRDMSFEAGRTWIPVNYGCFEGALIHRRVVDRIGYPDKRFFLLGDDQIYGYQASRHTNVIYVDKVCFQRLLPAPAELTEGRCYFELRNRFLTREHLAASGLPTSDASLWFQNLLLIGWLLRSTRPRRPTAYWRNLSGMLGGVWDGARGRFGPPPWVRRSEARRHHLAGRPQVAAATVR